jgi:hypothetical protein
MTVLATSKKCFIHVHDNLHTITVGGEEEQKSELKSDYRKRKKNE